MLKRTAGESFVAGFRRIMLLSAGLALLSALGAWLMIDGKRINLSTQRGGAGDAEEKKWK